MDAVNKLNPYSPADQIKSAGRGLELVSEISFAGIVTADDVVRLTPRLWIGCLMQVLAAFILVPMFGLFLSLPFLQSSSRPLDTSVYIGGALLVCVLAAIIVLASWLVSRRRQATRLIRLAPWMTGEVVGSFRTAGFVIRNQQTVDYQQLSWSSLKTVRVTEHGVCLSRVGRHDAFIALPARLFKSFDAGTIRQTLADLRRQCDSPPTVSVEDCRDQCPDDGFAFETLIAGTTDLPKTNPVITTISVIGIVLLVTGIPFGGIEGLGGSWIGLTLAFVFLVVWAVSWFYAKQHPSIDLSMHLTGWISPTECQMAMPGSNRKLVLAEAIDVTVSDNLISYAFPDDNGLVFDKTTFTPEQWLQLNDWAKLNPLYSQSKRESPESRR